MRSARLLLVLPLVATALIAACADQPVIWFENHRNEAVTVSIDGDRLVVLRPHTTEYLPYTTAAWAWPRRVDVAAYSRFGAGEPLWSASLDADDLARQRWTIYIRP